MKHLLRAHFKQPKDTEKLRIHDRQLNWQSMDFIPHLVAPPSSPNTSDNKKQSMKSVN